MVRSVTNSRVQKGNMENSSEIFFIKLKNSEKPGVTLASYYCTLFGLDVTRSEVIMCNKLVKAFGRQNVFYAIQDIGNRSEPPEEPYAYLYEVCRRRFEASHIDSTYQARVSLESYISGLEKEIENVKKQKIKIPSSEGLKKDG